MVQISQAYRDLKNALEPLYGSGESAQIANLVLKHITGMGPADRLVHGADLLSPERQAQFDNSRRELLLWRPVQYVVGEAWFSGMRFSVDERVLIPRPETEELVEWIVNDVGFRMSDFGFERSETCATVSHFRNPRSEIPYPQSAILDIGTGSGCIPITLKKKLPLVEVWTMDKSSDALTLARQNAAELKADLHFLEMDVLDRLQWENLTTFDIIVSNPPYVPESDRKSMLPNVRDHEPHMALFVPDEDPLLFYRAIAELGLSKLKDAGKIFFEIHLSGWEPLRAMLSGMGYREISLRQDLGGTDRMVSAIRP
jgi:release factor glutamine methyltransferase